MRLGDLDALKEHAKNILVGESINTVLGINLYKILEEIIDNAPIVDTDEIYKKGYHNGFFATHGEPERPHGKWKLLYKGDEGHSANYECSICQREIYFDAKTDSLADYPFCHCGADMRDNEK